MVLFPRRGWVAVVWVAAAFLHAAGLLAQPLTFTTFAGSDGGTGSDDATGSAARFHFPAGTATDGSGNIYVADRNNHTVRKVTPAGAVTTLAGLAGISGSADGTGHAARFNTPSAVATDSGGNVYVADFGNHTIRKITPAGAVTTLAGLAGTTGSADETGSAARFNEPRGVAADSSGNVYVADSRSHTIRKITPAGTVTTLAGLAGMTGTAEGMGSAARFGFPVGVATDGNGNVYVADFNNHAIRRITSAGVVDTLAGRTNPLGSGSADGTGSAAQFNSPEGVATDGSGNVYVADTGNRTIRKISPAGAVTTLAGLPGTFGSVDGTGGDARFRAPAGVATDSGGNVYVGDTFNHTIRKITPAGVVTTLAGLARGFGSTDGTGRSARFNSPNGVATDSSGNVYVAEQNNNVIRKISPAGVVSTLAGLAGAAGSADGTGSAARFDRPNGVATDSSGNVFVAEFSNHTIRKITPAGVVSTLAGLAGAFGSADGTGSAARFRSPFGVATDSSGNVFVADLNNSTIRKITPVGVVTTLAGLAGSSGTSDGTGSIARFNFPSGVATDGGGNVYVADTNSDTIRKITPAGVVSTLAGMAGSFGSVDGTGSSARFAYPAGVATDSSGNVYVVDQIGHTLRKITPAGVVSTPAGLAGTFGNADGTGSAARFYDPTAVATDSAGNVFVADLVNHTIRIGKPALPDVATIDRSTGSPGVTRLLDAAPQTATAWQWSVIRRPVDSIALLSSTTVRNPTFTPDVPGLFSFRLHATGAAGASIATVDLTASLGVPGDVNGDTRVSVADVFYLINFLFVGGAAPVGPGDANGDGRLSVADVFYLINFLFVGGPAPL